MDETMRRAWAARVRPAREAAGLSQRDLAARAHLTPRTLRDMELGHSVPRVEKLLGVLAELGIDPGHDPSIESDREAIVTLLVSLVRRLPAERRDEWAQQMVNDLGVRLTEAAGTAIDLDKSIAEYRRLAHQARNTYTEDSDTTTRRVTEQ